jgi:hypothetical protein
LTILPGCAGFFIGILYLTYFNTYLNGNQLNLHLRLNHLQTER